MNAGGSPEDSGVPTGFERKKADLMAGRPQVDKRVASAELATVGVKGRAEWLRGVIFESHVAMQSPLRALPGTVLVGAHTYMNDGGYMRSRICIGRFCSIGRRVTIAAGMHAIEAASTSPVLRLRRGAPYSAAQRQELGLSPARPPWTVLDHDVWVGDGAVIMPGVRIGLGAVVGANAVVTRDVAPYAVVGGVPARTIRQRFPPLVAQRLLVSAWWERPLGELQSLPTANVFEFLESIESRPCEPDPYPSHALADESSSR